MTWWKLTALIAVVALLGTGMYTLRGERKAIDAEVADLEAKYNALKREEQSINDKIEYYSVPENLIKEAKSQFNYKEPGEQLMILVQPQVTATSTATSSATTTQE